MEIPLYPECRPLELEDKQILDEIFHQVQPRISEFTFANLWLFRHAHEYRLSNVDNTIVILGRGYDGEPYFLIPPSGNVEGALLRLVNDGLTLYGADNIFIDGYLRGKDVEITPDRDSFDYLYSRSDLADLPGNRFHKKKNRISYFISRHEYRVEIFQAGHIQGCIELLAEWRRVHEGMEWGNSSSLESDATDEALRMAEPLGLEGVVAIVDERVKAFALGERLNGDTSVCHFEKADPFLEGLYQLIDREFNRLLFIDCRFVNREQDLGMMNLRVSKLSYHPVELIEKYRVRKMTGSP